MTGFVDPEWYQNTYPDVGTVGLDPILHFIRHGLPEGRDPNGFFDGAWYRQHYPDVSAAGMHPLLHYLQTGAADMRNPHPNFDAVWYIDQHPEAAANALTWHMRTGRALGYRTEKPIDIHDYLPSAAAPMAPPRKVIVDVVIPVYRGLEETRRCLESVMADTGKPLGRIIVVDDKSPDAELSAWLRQLAEQGKIHLVRNPRNLGFVGSANRGMQEALPHDVILLNSDTQVAAGWVGRLAAQAYAEPNIASVSPLSNNATICGWPSNEGQPIPLGHTVTEIDDICRAVNPARWVDVPTTVGSCMYIRAKALQQVGLFDTERFTQGYGEENDFCLRASALGWSHRLACDTFVYHKGTVSFGNRKDKLAERAMKLLAERYPSYPADVARHVRTGDVTPYRFAVTAAAFRQSGLPVILLVAHDLGGGVRQHLDSLVRRFHDQARFLLLKATDRGATLSVASLPDHPSLTLPPERLDDLLLLLRSMHVTRVHIHHLLGIDTDIRALIQALGVPFDLTVHDYFAICPQINMLPWRHGLYCGEPDIAACNTCIANRPSYGARDIVTWRADHAWQFHQAARVFCPSHDVLSRLQRFGLAANAVLAPHEPVEAGPWPMRVVRPDDGPLRIAILGTLADHKGGRTVASVVEQADPAATVFHLIGSIDGPFSRLARKRVKVTGAYEAAALPGLIESIAPHLIWFPAAWPETYSYTLSAAIEAGIPIAATRIGAHPERLAGRKLTWLADIATPPVAWIKLFDQIRAALTAEVTAPPRPAVPDVYATNYLRPSAASRRLRRSRPRLVIVPERFPNGSATPCAYIRLLQPLFHPAVAGGFDVRVATATTVLQEHDADIIVTQRFAMPDEATASRLGDHARRTGATLLYDLDDDLLNIPRTHPEAKALRPRSKIARRTLDVADAVWVSTAGLAERLSDIRPDALVIENALDERIWTAPPASLHDQPVRILCMGTYSHDRDFALIEPALSRLKAEYGERIAIDILGMTGRSNMSPGLNRIGPPANAARSYAGFVQWLASAQPPWHIGLAPLLDTPFNHCKSPIKAMDYAALGLAVLASDTPVYQGSIADGPAGQLVPNSHTEWYAAVNWLLRNPDLRRTMAAAARPAFLATASLAARAETRRDALTRLLNHRNSHAAA